jgi:hypothetical protein
MVKYIDAIKAEIDSQVANGDASGIWDTFRGLAHVTTSGVIEFKRDPQTLEDNLHLLWYILIQGARNLSPEAFDQYRMLYTILSLRELGTLLRTAETGGNTIEVGNKKLWTDLPCLFDDVEAAWKGSDTNVSQVQRRNFTSFLAKMLAVGICGDDLAGLARDSFDRALQETSRLPLIDSISMVLIWFTFAGTKLTSMSGKSLHGLSPAGWLSLQNRLAELTDSDDGEMALLAMETYLKLYECVWQTANPMHPARNSIEDQYKHIVFLGKFCDRFPELAKPGWKQLVHDLRGDEPLTTSNL